jgi:hypothetical protein
MLTMRKKMFMHAGKLNKDSEAKCEDLQKNTGEMGPIDRHRTSSKNNEYAYEILVLTGARAKQTQGKLLYIFFCGLSRKGM